MISFYPEPRLETELGDTQEVIQRKALDKGVDTSPLLRMERTYNVSILFNCLRSFDCVLSVNYS